MTPKYHSQPVQQVLKGIAAAPGLVEGPVAIWQKEIIQVPFRNGCDPAKELARLSDAIDLAREELNELCQKLIAENIAEEAGVFEAQVMMLDDPELMSYVNDKLQQGLNGEAAWMDSIEFFASEIASIPNPTLSARAADLRDIGQRALKHLLGRVTPGSIQFSQSSVLVSVDLAPSETAALDKKKILAICTAHGGPTSHSAILAKALGIPAVVGLGEDLLSLCDGVPLLVDGSRGEVIAFPDEETITHFKTRCVDAAGLANEELKIANLPAVSVDGHKLEMVANVGCVDDTICALENGAEGIGLLRTEFLFLERQIAPDEEEQLSDYRKILDIMGDRPVVVRTIDIGGDKDISYLDLGHEDNPFLGWRAIRMCLDKPDFFKVQLRALLRSSFGHHLRIMFPMIATLAEVRRAKAFLEEARKEVVSKGQLIAEDIQVGIMVEIPSSAIMADQFAREVDFFSIGTNDLTQYTLAAERTNQKVAYLSDPCHPAVLRQIQNVIRAGHQNGIWIGVCGELAGDPDAIPFLMGMRLDEFSMSPKSIPHAKSIVRNWSFKQAKQLAKEVLQLDSASAVRECVRSWHPV